MNIFVGSRLSELESYIQIFTYISEPPKIVTIIYILLCIKWKVIYFETLTCLQISVI